MLVKKKLLGEYRVGRTIGEGAFSKVKLATHRVTNDKVAIKIIKKEDDKKEADAKKSTSSVSNLALSQLSKEVRLLMRLDHPNVIKLHQVIDTQQELYIVMEYASGGELIDYIAAKGSLGEKEGRRLFRQLVSAMDHCHLAGVIHRDLKLENMLLSSEKNLLLSDFGLGRTINGNEHYLNTFCGTPLYAAPELVSGIKYIGPSADIWSLGVVLYIMIAGRPPFKCETISELYQQIKSVKYVCPNTFSQDLKDLLGRLLVRDPQKRATMDELRADVWVNMGETEQPLRISPKLLAGDDHAAIDKLVEAIDTQEEFTAYYFRNSKAAQDEGIAINGPGSEHNSQEQLHVPQEPVIVEPIVIKNGRRTSGISRAPTPAPSKAPQEPQPRQRSASVAPGSSSYEAANKASAIMAKNPTPAIAHPTPNHGRRHSVAVGVPESVPPSNSSNSTGKTDSTRLSPSSSKEAESIYSSSGSTMAKPPKSIESIEPQPVKKSATLGIPMIATNKSAAPSMELISENEESDFANSKPVSSKAKTVDQETTNAANHRRRPSVIEAMGFHAQSGYTDEIRSLKYSTNLHTTNVYSPAEICAQIESLLQNRRFFSNLTVEKRGKYVWVCQNNLPRGKVTLEVEVVKVWLLRMSAVKVKRLGGEAISFKETYEQIISGLGW